MSGPELTWTQSLQVSFDVDKEENRKFRPRLAANEPASVVVGAFAGYEVHDNGDWSVGRAQERR